MKIEIKSWLNGSVLFEGDFSSIAEALTAAVKEKKDLSESDLSESNLSGSNLSGSDLSESDLSGSNLSGADLKTAYSQRTILPEGDLIGYKKLADGSIAKLRIPADAKRVGGLTGRKCRAEFAVVLKGAGVSRLDKGFRYEIGATVKPVKPFDPDPLDECKSGIHFFITREEAEAY